MGGGFEPPKPPLSLRHWYIQLRIVGIRMEVDIMSVDFVGATEI